jgi:ABC-2 type transport system ATP-binding protein
MPVVEIVNLTKDYASGTFLKKTVRALDDLSLAIEDKEIFGLIGPNGAGKTTTLKLLMGLIFPTSGEARILGQPIGDVPTKLHIGYLPENPYFYDYLTGRELLEYFGQLFGMSRTDRQKRVGDLLRQVDLLEAADMQLRKYSKGMIQRLGVAQAILNRPRIIFLDEPMSGLDPMGRRDMTRLIQELRDDGVTVVFSSHILPDVESLCDRVAILNKGKLVREGRLVEILDVSVQSIELVVHDLTNDLASELEGRAQRFRRMGRRSHLEFNDAQVVDEVLELLRAKGVRLVSVNPVKQTLEEYFVREVHSEGAEVAEGNNS